jgi:hypothetical protein
MPWLRPTARNPPSHRYQRGAPDQRDPPASAAAAGLFKDISQLVQELRLSGSIFDEAVIAIFTDVAALSAGDKQLEHRDEDLTAYRKTSMQRAASLVVIALAGVSLTACSHAMMMIHGTGARRPASTEFGLGRPRSSARGPYVATLEPERQLRPRQMQTVRVTVVDGDGRAIDGATLTIDCGMPQDGHGLPTRPRVTRTIGGGAYEFGPSRFDRYVDAVTEHRRTDGILTNDEVAGLKLFVGKANCTQCHNGPLLTNNEFHNPGVPRRPELPIDEGRLTGASSVLRDEFNCRSRWSDAHERCADLEFLVTADHTLQRAYKVPSLRNVAERAPYMDAGQLATLTDVLDHYNRAPSAPAAHTQIKPLRLTTAEL